MQGGETREGLEYAEDEIDNVHRVQREDAELDQYPQHQRNAKHSAEHQSPTIMPEYQHRGGEVSQSVHAQQCNTAPHKVLKKRNRQRAAPESTAAYPPCSRPHHAGMPKTG